MISKSSLLRVSRAVQCGVVRLQAHLARQIAKNNPLGPTHERCLAVISRYVEENGKDMGGQREVDMHKTFMQTWVPHNSVEEVVMRGSRKVKEHVQEAWPTYYILTQVIPRTKCWGIANMSTTSKAWVYGHQGYPEALRLTTVPVKQSLAPTEVRVRVKAAAINPVDIQLMNLPLWAYHHTFIAAPEHPTAEDFSGVIEAAGAESEWKAGDEIFGMIPILATGGLQEVIVLDTKAACLVPKPSAWSWEQAAALPLVYLTARTVIANVEPFVQSKTKPKVVVLGGSSSTGMYCVHIAAARGWEVIASCSGRNVDFVRNMGAKEVLDYTAVNVPEKVKALNADAIIDCVGGTECLGLAPRYVTIVGDKTSRANMGGAATYLWNPAMLIRSILGRWGLGKSYDCVNLDLKKEYLEETLRLPQDKIIIDSKFGFEYAKQAFERLNTGRARGKVVIKITD